MIADLVNRRRILIHEDNDTSNWSLSCTRRASNREQRVVDGAGLRWRNDILRLTYGNR